jgi:AraC family transcriptional regulator, activator of mtrCDE
VSHAERCDRNGSYGLLDGLSQPVSESLSDVPVVALAFGAMLEEVATPLEGTMALTSALMKACLIVLLRRHLQSSRNSGMLPALFADVRIARGIAAVLDRPAVDHSVASLAKEAGMSRSAFAREFKSTLDVTPMEFVTRVRLNRARLLLATTGHPVETIAADVGFSSRSHFSRLFRAHFGMDPSSFRRFNPQFPDPARSDG